jgi:hypothetical protein
VIGDSDNHALFAVEVDGPQHNSPVQSERDRKKDGLSERFGLPLLRICAGDIWNNSDKWDEFCLSVEIMLDGDRPCKNAGGDGRVTSDSEIGSPPAKRGVALQPICPLCRSSMVKKRGRYGSFLSCVRFPTCRGTIDLPEHPFEPPGGRVSETTPAFAFGQVLRWVLIVARDESRVFGSRIRALPRGLAMTTRICYQSIPDWLQAILWGLGISGGLLLLARLLWWTFLRS